MTGVTLRPYQRDAIANVIAARRAGVKRMVVSLPTGSGKTVIFSELARLARRPVLVIAHRRELVQQARDKVARALGDASVVAVEQGVTTAHDGAHVVVASIRSLSDERLARVVSARRFGLVVYDECHHATAEDNRLSPAGTIRVHSVISAKLPRKASPSRVDMPSATETR